MLVRSILRARNRWLPAVATAVATAVACAPRREANAPAAVRHLLLLSSWIFFVTISSTGDQQQQQQQQQQQRQQRQPCVAASRPDGQLWRS